MDIHIERTAAWLIKNMSIFSSGRYQLYGRVRVANVQSEDTLIPKSEREEIFDLLVCQGEEVIMGIVCHAETERLFTRYLPGMSYARLPREEDINPVPDPDGSYSDGPSSDAMRALSYQILRRLREIEGRGTTLESYRRWAMGQHPRRLPIQYFLPAVPVRGTNRRFMALRWIDADCRLINFQESAGLFLRYRPEPSGDLGWSLMTTGPFLKALENQIHPKSRRKSLSQRLEELSETDDTQKER